MRKIDPGKRLFKPFSYQPQELPIDRPVVLYIRQSSEGQVKYNIQSLILQDEEMGSRLGIVGFTTIIKIDIDQGMSGQKRKDEREGLASVYRLAERGEVGAVAAYDASRWYRDQTHTEYNEFIQVLIKYNLPAILFDEENGIRVYWPHRQTDMDALREEFKAAAFYLRHIYGKVIPAKMKAVESGSFGGGSVSMGLVVTGEKKHRVLVVYPPHAEHIRFIFKRYRELNGNLPRLGRELQTTGFSFPAFDLDILHSMDVEKAPYVTLRYKNGGYPCYTREALLSILTNPVYIGWYVYGGAIISKTAHEPIVDMDDFLYAFSRLSPVNLDGTENVNRPKVERRYTSAEGLVETLLTCNGNPCYAFKNTYMVREHVGKWQCTTLSIPMHTIDIAISTAILGVLSVLDKRHTQGLTDDLYQQIKTLAQEKAAEGVSLYNALKNIDGAIRGWELDKQSCRETGNKTGLDEANRQLKILYTSREQIVAKAEQAAKEQTALQETMSLHQQIMQNWFEWPVERRRRYVSLIVESVTMEEVSPHVLKLVLTYKSPIVCTLTGYVLRKKCGARLWTDEELLHMRTLYPLADRADILRAMPNRTWMAIRQQAREMGLTRSTWEDTSGIASNRIHTDIQLIESLQAEYPLFGKTIEAVNAPVGGVWQPFDSAVFSVNNIPYPLHHQPGEHSPPGMMD